MIVRPGLRPRKCESRAGSNPVVKHFIMGNHECTLTKLRVHVSMPLCLLLFLFIFCLLVQYLSLRLSSPHRCDFVLAKPSLLFFPRAVFYIRPTAQDCWLLIIFMMAYLGMATELAVSRAENCLQALALSENTVLMGHLGIIVPFLCFTGIGRYGGINSQCRKSNNHSMVKEVSILYSDET